MSKFFSFLSGAVFFSLFLMSCDKESSVENGLLPGSANNNGGGNNNPAVCKSCSYLPWCNGSVYNYQNISSTGTTTETNTFNILADTTIAGVVYSKTDIDGSGDYVYHNCTNGNSTMIIYNVLPGTTTLSEFKTTALKANDPVGTTWTDTYNYNGSNIDYNYTIIAKSVPRTVLGVNYPDVIKVHVIISTTVPVVGTVVASESDEYYARNVGLIESIEYDGATGAMLEHRSLQSYQIP